MINTYYIAIYSFFINLFSNTQFSQNLMALNLYQDIGLVSSFLTILFLLLFYFIINHPRFNEKKHWFFVMFINALIIIMVTFFWVYTVFQQTKGIDTNILDILGFSIINAIISSIFFVALSCYLKRFSINCSTTPF